MSLRFRTWVGLTLAFAGGFWPMHPRQVRAEFLTSFTESVTGLSTPYSFGATSGSGTTTPGEFTEDIAPGGVLPIALSANVSAEASGSTLGTSVADVSVLSTFSITNTSTDGATLLVGFTPIFQYFVSVVGSSSPVQTGLASITLSNATTGEAFTDMIADGARSPGLSVQPTISLASLAPGESVDIVAGFKASARAGELVTATAYNTALGMISLTNTSTTARGGVRAKKSSAYIISTSVIPEPASFALCAVGVSCCAGFGLLRRRPGIESRP